MRVLLADDEQEILILIRESIQSLLQVDIDIAENGLDAYLMCREKKYDLIITDHKMPFMMGSAFIVAVRTKENLNKETPFIMLSAHINDEMKKGLSLPSIEFLSKPYREDEFLNLVSPYFL